MKKEFLLSIILMLLFFSCNNSENCSSAYFKQQNCNIVVTDNINKSSHWGGTELINPKGNPENVPLEYYLINSPHD